jgi:hypothetical protein
MSSKTIRLSLNEKLEKVFRDLQQWQFPLLEYSEILKTITSEYYVNLRKKRLSSKRKIKIPQYKNITDLKKSKPLYLVSTETEKKIGESVKDYQNGNYVTIKVNDSEALDDFLEISN